MPTAILVDGSFFLKRYRYLRGSATPDQVAKDMVWMCNEHLRDRSPSTGGKGSSKKRSLYRIFYYDCAPLTKRIQNPVSKKGIDLGKSATAIWRTSFFELLKRKRKVAIRLGYINGDSAEWKLSGKKLTKLLRGSTKLSELKDEDVVYDAKQKGVDIRIGLDIASLAYKKQVDQIVLVSGDSDFVPAAKLARREGIDFILDPMWATIRSDLHEHIDGLRSAFPRDRQHQEPQGQNEQSAQNAGGDEFPATDTADPQTDN
ncbi:NYN domain-containing protein [Aeoliella mucimassa]|uniref:NYN domain protein n=1 Tax=Aeoliella mucimassa TaxID=2527972 RepID=A0A518ARY1_9BACT|nr:NYN domain-containing protein [Aeoliella mucimassa]QDU57466.1 NYN domain protein [Aeoliella mucimassa]